jgi:hypothetical protein
VQSGSVYVKSVVLSGLDKYFKGTWDSHWGFLADGEELSTGAGFGGKGRFCAERDFLARFQKSLLLGR